MGNRTLCPNVTFTLKGETLLNSDFVIGYPSFKHTFYSAHILNSSSPVYGKSTYNFDLFELDENLNTISKYQISGMIDISKDQSDIIVPITIPKQLHI